MTPKTRLMIILPILLTACVIQFSLRSYLEASGPLQSVALLKPLEQFPTRLGDWRGIDREPDDDQKLYGDQYIQRYYIHPSQEKTVALWLTYSQIGDDRNHHPEVCMTAAGKREDRAARQTCPVEGSGNPPQQYRFEGPTGDRQWVFYWHYTLSLPDQNEAHPLQDLYRRLRRRPSSVTIEVFAPENSSSDLEFAQEFVRLVDSSLRNHVGPDAIRGNQRLRVTVVDPEVLPELN